MESRPSTGPNRKGRPYRSLRGRDEFSWVYRTGSRRRCGAVVVIMAGSDARTPRVGFVAGRRVGSAVSRNRAKRRMREAMSRCTLRPDTVYVLVADRGVLTADFDTLVSWISNCSGEEAVVKEKR